MTDELTANDYRDAFREVMQRLLDYETGKTPPPASDRLRGVIERDAIRQVRGQ